MTLPVLPDRDIVTAAATHFSPVLLNGRGGRAKAVGHVAPLMTGELAGDPHLPIVGPAVCLTSSLSSGSVITLQAPHGVHFSEWK